MPAELPDRIDTFAVLEQLGEGGMGVVYSAYDEELDRKLAIKLLHHVDERAQQRMRREAQALARIAHPNVVHVYRVGIWEGRLYLAMEFIYGLTLGQWCAQQGRTRAEILAVMSQAAEGLSAAHEAGLVHRDFKPDNVMVGADGRVRVLDFGLANVDHGGEQTLESLEVRMRELAGQGPLDTPLTETGTLLGTPAYMSPEQLRAQRIDARSDQFSFCVTLYEALYGERPFAGDQLLTLGLNVMRGNVRPEPATRALPEQLRAALLRGLSPQPGDRFEDLAGLLDALELGGTNPGAGKNWLGIVGLIALGSLLHAALNGGADISATELLVSVLGVSTYVLGLAWALRRLGERVDARDEPRRLWQLAALSVAWMWLGRFSLLGLGALANAPLPNLGAVIAGDLIAGLGCFAGIHLASRVMRGARGALAAFGWALIAGLGAPPLSAMIGNFATPPDSAISPSTWMLVGSAAALLEWSWRPRASLSTGARIRARVALVGLALLGLSLPQQLLSNAFRTRWQPLALAPAGTEPQASGACECLGCNTGRFAWRGSDKQRWTLDNGERVARLEFSQSGLEKILIGGSEFGDPSGELFVPAGRSTFTLRKPDTWGFGDYCLALALEPLQSSVSSSEAQPEAWVDLTWSWDPTEQVWRSSVEGLAPPGATLVVEVPRLWLGHGDAVVGGSSTPAASAERLREDILISRTFRVGDDGRWRQELVSVGLAGELEDAHGLVRVAMTESPVR